jgi:hypothetical protein
MGFAECRLMTKFPAAITALAPLGPLVATVLMLGPGPSGNDSSRAALEPATELVVVGVAATDGQAVGNSSTPDAPAVASGVPTPDAMSSRRDERRGAAPDRRVDIPELSTSDPFAAVTSPDAGDHCAANLDADGLGDFFGGTIGTFQGADYQRSFKLPDGRVLWTFQDAFVSGVLVHNVGMVQSGRCFTTLNNGARSWLLGDQTSHMRQWHWIFDGAANADGTEFHLYVAQMTARTDDYIDGKVDVTGLDRVVLDAATLEVKTVIPETIEGRDLYGWSVTNDTEWTYLYSHCYLQFGHAELGAHECAEDTKLARVPLGRLGADRDYWDGLAWNPDPASAINIVDGLFIVPTGFGPLPSTNNPVNVRFDGEQFMMISNPGDWWGDRVFIATADQPQGPWTVTSEEALVAGKCDGRSTDCSTYYASWVPWLDSSGDHLWSIGHNTWDVPTTDALWVYRPTFHRHTPLQAA